MLNPEDLYLANNKILHDARLKISLWLLLSQAHRMQDPQRGSWGIFFSRNLRILRLWSLIRISFMITVAADHIFSSIKTILSSQLCLL